MSKKILIIVGMSMSLGLLGLIVLQALWIRSATQIKEENFDQLVQQALIEATYSLQRNETLGMIYEEAKPEENDSSEEEIFNRILNRRDLIDKIVYRMFNLTPAIEERISPDDIREYLGRALENQNIETEYEFAVANENGENIFVSEGYYAAEKKQYYQIELFPDDFLETSNYLLVYFPDRKKFIVHSLGYMGVSSAILVIFLIVTFSFTLYVILKQKKLADMKSDFINNMTHELKTPISTISLASQMLSDKSIAPEQKNLDRLSGIITDETKRLGFQVERVLQMAKFDQGDLSLQFEDISIHEIIESVIANFVLQIDSRKGVLVPSLHADRDLITGDPVHIGNIISNLLDNAVKYTENSPEILVETRNVDQYLLITIRDNGIGISKANQKRVFDKFYRVSTGNIHNVKGFGLGLSYVKRIVDEHHGSISLESEPDVGTSFFLKIPLKKINHERN